MRALAGAERAALSRWFAHRVDDAPTIEIPLLATDVHDLEALDHIADHLFGAAE